MPNSSTARAAITSPPSERLTELWSRRYGEGVPAPNARWTSTIDTILAHRSVRNYRADTALPKGAIEIAVAAAQSAPSSSNLQAWDVIVIEDPERKARINSVSGNQRHIRDAPVLLVWVSNLARLRAISVDLGVEAEGLNYLESFLLGAIDAALAAQNALVALESLGLGTCYIGALRNHPDVVAAELGLPPEAVAIFGMTVGVPDDAAPAEVKPRLPQRAILHRETFAATTTRDLDTYNVTLHQFQSKQGLPKVDWTRQAVNRVATAEALKNREHLRGNLEALGFPLK